MHLFTSRRKESITAGTALAIVAIAALTGCGALSPAATATPTLAPTEEATATPDATNTPAETATPSEVPATPTEAVPPDEITVKNAEDLVEVRTINASPTWISGLSFSPVDHQVATFGLGRNVDIWDADSGERTIHLGTQADWGLGLAFSPDATRLVSGSSGGDVVVWDLEKEERLASVQSPPSRVYDIEWHPDSERFAVVGQESSRVVVFDASGTKKQEMKTPSGWLWSLAWSESFLAVSNDTTEKIYVYNADGYGNAGEVDSPHAAGEMDFSPDESLLIGCLRVDGSMHIWETEDWTEKASWDAHPTKGIAQGCIGGAFSKDGTVYFSGGDDGNMIAWDVETGDRLKTFEFGKMVWKISVSGDGKLVAAGLDDGQVKIIGIK